MSIKQEKEFERLVPMRSVLGAEFLGLQKELNKQRTAFESCKDRMGYDTISYRRAEITLGRFLDDFIPLIHKANAVLAPSKERLEIAEAKLQNKDRGIVLTRKMTKRIWIVFALERYRLFAKPLKKEFKKYHPGMWKDLLVAWSVFRKEVNRWMYGGQPYDGSQAMAYMIDFQIKCRLMSSIND